MRRLSNRLASLACIAMLVSATRTRGDDGDGYGNTHGSTTAQLIAERGLDRGAFSPNQAGLLGEPRWTLWWFSNRQALLAPVVRARRLSVNADLPVDAAARERARAALLAALSSKNEYVASEAALALGRLGDPRDIATLSGIVADADIASSVRKHRYAALGLGVLPLGETAQAAQARRALLGALDAARGRRDEHAVFWQYCAYALAMRGDAAVVPDLVALRRKGLAGADAHSALHADVLNGICISLGALGGADALPEIKDHLESSRAFGRGSKDTSWGACHALANVRGNEATALLRRAATDERLVVRRVALQALGSVADASDDATAGVLRNALAKDDDPLCREMAAISLGRIGHASCVPTLLAALTTCEDWSRPCFAVALALSVRGKPNNPAVSKALLGALELKTSGEFTKSGLALACGLAGVDDARPRLVEIAGHSNDEDAVAQAAFALGLLGGGVDERAVLHKLLVGSRFVGIEREAALALGMLRDVSVIDDLKRVVSDETSESEVARAAAVVSLGRVGDDTDIDFFLDLLRRPETHINVRAYAIQGLGLLLDRSGNAALASIAADSVWYILPRCGWMLEAPWDVQRLVD